MEKMMNSIDEYVKQQEEVCRQNDYIAPCVYDEYGVPNTLEKYIPYIDVLVGLK